MSRRGKTITAADGTKWRVVGEAPLLAAVSDDSTPEGEGFVSKNVVPIYERVEDVSPEVRELRRIRRAVARPRKRRSRPRQRLTHLDYARFADDYLKFECNIRLLAAAWGMSESAARKRIHTARREKELLTETGRGQKGGELTPKAKELLRNHR